jgi:DNA-binding transcriptional LysR family regulator
MLDVRRREIFCAVAEEGSFTAAAACLHLTQSAVSQQVAILERDIGARLMERVSRGIKVTPVGRALAERARLLLRDVAGLEQELRRMVISPTQVKLGVFATAGAHLVPMVVGKFRQRHPHSQLVLCASQPEDMASELANGTIDIGLTWDYDFLPRPRANLARGRVLIDPMCLVLPRDHPLAAECEPISLGELAGELWVVRGHTSPQFDDAFPVMCRIAGFEPNIVFRTEDYQSVQGLVAAGIGIAVLPRLSLAALRSDIVVRPIDRPTFARRIDAIMLPDAGDTPLVRQVLALLDELWIESSAAS